MNPTRKVESHFYPKPKTDKTFLGSIYRYLDKPHCVSFEYIFLREKSKAMENPFPNEYDVSSIIPGVFEFRTEKDAPLFSSKDHRSIKLSKLFLED